MLLHRLLIAFCPCNTVSICFSYNYLSVRAVCCAYAQRFTTAHEIDVKQHWRISLLLLVYHFTISSWPYNALRMQLMAIVFFSFSFFLSLFLALHISAHSLNLFDQIWCFSYKFHVFWIVIDVIGSFSTQIRIILLNRNCCSLPKAQHGRFRCWSRWKKCTPIINNDAYG